MFCTKAGGSLGLCDVIAIGPSDVHCVHVISPGALGGCLLVLPTNGPLGFTRRAVPFQ
jgi:hypothetical protein